MKYGYARVSSKAQDYQAQVEALKAAGCEEIFSEKQSGKSRSGRPEFARLMKKLLPCDTVVVTNLDRLALCGLPIALRLRCVVPRRGRFFWPFEGAPAFYLEQNIGHPHIGTGKCKPCG